uniref:T-cell surface glycoprotein CD3 zeta chain n=1 Tax=Zosterops lateralis melanops TaxID=1220523 RepID=A0A8D2NR55_ZOSLA
MTLFADVSDFFFADAASVLGLTDPRLCYVLDGLLFIYAVIMTALFVKAKVSPTQHSSMISLSRCPCPAFAVPFQKLSRGHRDDYDVLGGRRGADPELGGRHQVTSGPCSLQKDKMGEAYSEIGMKGERRRGKGNEGLYQGLSAATKDTYDALQMQPLPPR